MQRKIHSKVPLIHRDIRNDDRLIQHMASFGNAMDRDQQRGRFASHDRIAMCLLRKDIESALPVRREIRIARNRRRLKFVAGLCVAWWVVGRFLLG